MTQKKKATSKKSSQVQVLKGKLEISRSGMGFVIVENQEKDVLIRPNDFGKAFNGDVVRVQVPKGVVGNKRIEGKIIDVVERNQTTFVGTVQVKKNIAFFEVSGDKPIPDFYIPIEKLNGAVDGDRVIAKFIKWDKDDKKPQGEIESVITSINDSDLAMKEILIEAKQFNTKTESPNSLKTLNSTEIERLPGAGRDVSKVIAALPGVASRATFRNDIIIRGGSPGENKFYLDGIEVPNINHFATQGSSGGPVGLLNVNFIREVDFYSGAFPSNRANGLSSVLSFKQKDGNPDALITNFALGSSDAALTMDGPIGKKVDFILSISVPMVLVS
jgi:hypothetical protein